MLTKEDYDQIDAEEMELMDIKWCLASVLRRAEKFKMITGRNDFLDAHVSTLGFDKSKVTCFKCREKGHFKRECKNRDANDAKNPFGKDDYYRKAIYQQVGQQQQKEPQVAHGRKVIKDSKRACLGNQESFNWNKYISSDSKACLINQDDERLPEGFSWDMFVDEKGEFKAFIAKIVKEPDIFTEWMKSIGVSMKNEDQKYVSSEECSQSSDESLQSDESSEREVVFDQTPSDSGSSDDSYDKSIEFDQSPTDDSSDDEEEKHINVAKSHLSPESFHFYFADRLEKLKERRAAKEQKQMKSEGVAQQDEIVQVEEVKIVAEEVDEAEKVTEAEKVVETEKIIEVEKIVEVIKPCSKCLESCKECAAKDEKLAEYEKMKEQLLFNLNYVKESYGVLNRTVTGLQKTNSEREDALTMMNATLMTKQKAINHYIEENAKLKQELEFEKIENERIRHLLQSYSSFDYLIDRIYPTVAGFEAFKNDKPKEKDTGGSAEEEQKKPFWKQSNQEFLAEKKRTGTRVFHKKDTRICFRCNEAGHIASICSQMAKPKQGVSEKTERKSCRC
ncbi:putative transcription factor interactor and regulator CCHC(Zn) family [Helianthus annuus]|nr:putative transcription factor interactor and regulator CCHC(Zn) family [Helianthus annuus]KAJ0562474.1 putative transcription factor interactor and regulator CCHC(Zn) family [Helianthus annuus]KAJ0727849.1 putative transcription factor interactor and regulator CCHC(Zn) family [Helianthus annuus]KAJ0730632.1 putative transcription factor interactor and regulator CCHC(Zn) family [Helianthus annuus]